MDLLLMRRKETARKLKMTILHRPNSVWHREEINRLTGGLMTEVSFHPHHPADIILLGHYTKEQTLEALWGGMAYTATQIIGMDSKELPFRPPFM